MAISCSATAPPDPLSRPGLPPVTGPLETLEQRRGPGDDNRLLDHRGGRLAAGQPRSRSPARPGLLAADPESARHWARRVPQPDGHDLSTGAMRRAVPAVFP